MVRERRIASVSSHARMGYTSAGTRSAVVALAVLAAVATGACSKREGPPESQDETVAAEPPRPKPLVSAKTLAELEIIRDFQRANVPDIGPEPVQQSNETSMDFEERHRQWSRKASSALRRLQKDLQTFCVTPAMAYANCRHSKLTKHIKDPATGFTGEEWECYVYDVKRAGIGVEILCSTTTADDWTYSVIGSPPKGTKIAKGDLLRFKKLDVGVPRKDDPVKMTFVYGNNFQENRERLGVEVVASATP